MSRINLDLLEIKEKIEEDERESLYSPSNFGKIYGRSKREKKFKTHKAILKKKVMNK